MTGNPALIKAGVVPLRDEINSRNLPELLRELSESVDQHGIPLVFWYEINGVKVLEFPGFSGHQTGLRSDREAPSKFPSRNGMEKLLHSAGVKPEQLPQKSGASPAQEEVEVEGEVEDEEILPPPQRAGARTPNGATAEHPLRAEFDRVASRLESDEDRRCLRAILQRAPVAQTFLAEVDASLDGMAGHIAVTRTQAGRALREFVSDGKASGPEPPKLRQLRRYLEVAALEEPVASRASPATNGAAEKPDWQLTDAERWDRAAARLEAEEKAASAARAAGVAHG
jgi:hypothetical protein